MHFFVLLGQGRFAQGLNMISTFRNPLGVMTLGCTWELQAPSHLLTAMSALQVRCNRPSSSNSSLMICISDGSVSQASSFSELTLRIVVREIAIRAHFKQTDMLKTFHRRVGIKIQKVSFIHIFYVIIISFLMCIPTKEKVIFFAIIYFKNFISRLRRQHKTLRQPILACKEIVTVRKKVKGSLGTKCLVVKRNKIISYLCAERIQISTTEIFLQRT